nr:DUF2272 domain-containing protein [Roseomonas acroporae]
MLSLLLLPALLLACASPPSATPGTAVPIGGLRGAVLRVSVEEWQAWGRLTVDGWVPYLPPGQEAAPENYTRILGYWGAVPDGPGVIAQHRRNYASMREELAEAADLQGGRSAMGVSISFWGVPFWSAAFISHVMLTAGVPDFPLSSAHARYIDILLARYLRDPDGAAFVPHDIDEFAPRPGDLLCADRSGNPIQRWQERLAQAGRPRPMHCDVIVANAGGVAEAIGGNVLDAVVKRRFPTDAAGHVLQAPLGEPAFFVVLEDRLDRVDAPLPTLLRAPSPSGPAAAPGPPEPGPSPAPETGAPETGASAPGPGTSPAPSPPAGPEPAPLPAAARRPAAPAVPSALASR